MNITTTAHSTAQPASRGVVRYLPTIGRILLGLPMVVFGLNSFFNFIPPPPTPLPDGAVAFAGALVESGYMMPLIGVTQLLVGTLLLLNRFVPLALVLLAPFLVNSVLFHAMLERSGFPPALVFTALTLALAWHHRRAYAPLFIARVR